MAKNTEMQKVTGRIEKEITELKDKLKIELFRGTDGIEDVVLHRALGNAFYLTSLVETEYYLSDYFNIAYGDDDLDYALTRKILKLYSIADININVSEMLVDAYMNLNAVQYDLEQFECNVDYVIEELEIDYAIM